MIYLDLPPLHASEPTTSNLLPRPFNLSYLLILRPFSFATSTINELTVFLTRGEREMPRFDRIPPSKSAGSIPICWSGVRLDTEGRRAERYSVQRNWMPFLLRKNLPAGTVFVRLMRFIERASRAPIHRLNEGAIGSLNSVQGPLNSRSPARSSVSFSLPCPERAL